MPIVIEPKSKAASIISIDEASGTVTFKLNNSTQSVLISIEIQEPPTAAFTVTFSVRLKNMPFKLYNLLSANQPATPFRVTVQDKIAFVMPVPVPQDTEELVATVTNLEISETLIIGIIPQNSISFQP